MFNHILIPLDGSWAARRIVSDALVLARAANARVTFAHVISNGGKAETRPALDASSAAAIEALDNAVGDASSAGILADTEILSGDPRDVLVEYARSSTIDTIAMTSHGYSGIKRLVLGSVADAVIRSSPVPVLLRHSPSADETQDLALPKRIMVPLDGSDLAERAIPFAVELARLAHGELILTRVVEYHDIAGLDPTLAPESFDHEFAEVVMGQQAAHCRTYLTQVSEALSPRGIPVTTSVRFGAVAPTIRRSIAEDNIDLVALATHGRSGLKRLTLGSVATDLVQHSSRLFLLVSPHVPAQDAGSSSDPTPVPNTDMS